MRAFLILAILAQIVASPAQACQVPIEPPRAFWNEPPPTEQLKPNELVLEVTFRREAQPYDPNRLDVVVMSTCGPDRVFRITRVLAGDDPAQSEILLPVGYLLEPNRPRLILVGQLAPWKEPDPNYRPDKDTSLRFFWPRSPPR